MFSVEPPKLLGGERRYAVMVAFTAIVIATMATRVNPVLAIATAAVFYLVGIGLLRWSWHLDAWMSVVLMRFREYPAFMPAHPSVMSSARKRDRVRRQAIRARLKR